MNIKSTILQEAHSAATLSIGDVAARTGVGVATLRMWETRHGFPNPERLESGHRRYRETDVVAVRAVLERRDAGVRLDVAIGQAIEDAYNAARPPVSSVFAEVRRHHPNLAAYQLRKSTLLGLSWAIEDEFCAKADQAHLFGVFQHESRYRESRHRWRELARVARSAHVFAEFTSPCLDANPTEVQLAEDSPMRREWAVICDAAELPAALVAWELPGQTDTPDHARLFESMWTVEPAAVRDAALVCAGAALEAGSPHASTVLDDLHRPLPIGTTDLATVTTLFNRVVAYVDAAADRYL